jgi:signal peptidase II
VREDSATRARTTRDHASAISAWRSPLAWVVLLGVLVLGIAADISTKYWSFATIAGEPVVLDREKLLADRAYQPIPNHARVPALPGRLLDFRLVINRGAVFGLGADQRLFFIVFTLGAIVVGLYVFGRYTTARSTLAHAALGMILAGGLGNLYDRIVYGVVRDFLHMLPGWHLPFGLRWPRWFGGSPEIFPWVFNVADVMLLTGMVLLMLHIHRMEKQRSQSEARPEAGSGERPRSDGEEESDRPPPPTPPANLAERAASPSAHPLHASLP